MRYNRLMRWLRSFRLRAALLSVPCLPFPMCVDSMVMVRNAGYTPMKPPNTLYGPGAVVGVTARGDYIEIYGICGVRSSLGRSFVPISSPTQREELSRAAEKRFKVGARVIESLQGDITLKHIRYITVQFDNPRIMALQVEDVIANMSQRSETCRNAIEAVRAQPDSEVTMVTSTLEGDLTYSIGWEIGYDFDVTATIPAMVDLAAILGIGQAHCTTRTIQSKALIWGIKDDPFLLELSVRGSMPKRLLSRKPTRLLPADQLVDLSMDPIAPIEPSENPANEQYRSTSLEKVTVETP